jgi:hypothetical protein
MRSITLLLLLLALVACATAPVARQIDRQVNLPGVDFDDAWNAVIDLFGERNWTIDNMEKASGFITSDWMGTSTGTYVDCGSPGIGADQNHRGRFNVVVREGNGGVSVTVNTTWQATRVLMGERGAIECVSTGLLEREVHGEIRRRLGADDR